MRQTPVLIDHPCETTGHDEYQAIVHDRDCDVRLCRQCLNLHRCGQSNRDPCSACGGWGQVKRLQMGVITFSLNGLWAKEQCGDCRGRGY